MNLLPNTEKKALKKGLKLRFMLAALFLLSVSFLVGFIMLLPSYFLTLVNFSEIMPENFALKAKNDGSIEKILNLPVEIDSKLKIFQLNVNGVSPTDSFSKIIGYLPEKVKLNSVLFARNQIYKEKNGIVILISGMALDRDSLVSFSTHLKESNLFSAIEVPVFSLTKERNLPFSMNIFIENQK